MVRGRFTDGQWLIRHNAVLTWRKAIATVTEGRRCSDRVYECMKGTHTHAALKFDPCKANSLLASRREAPRFVARPAVITSIIERCELP